MISRGIGVNNCPDDSDRRIEDCVIPFSGGSTQKVRRQNLTSKVDIRTERIHKNSYWP